MKLLLEPDKKAFFASDFHLGAAVDHNTEKRILSWLNSIEKEVGALFLVGDIFDFWFEYKYVIPKGFVRLQGKLAALVDNKIPVFFFTGNHDMWMFDYFEKELRVKILREPVDFDINNKKILIGHGDGLGPGDKQYKRLKKIFSSKICQRLFALLHPGIGIRIARYWSSKSRISGGKKEEFSGEEHERLLTYCREEEKSRHRDYYIFGHRHLPLDLEVEKGSRYINLGDWINGSTYAVFDGDKLHLKTFDEK